jgi:Ser/Thr protein kinase RdoA (MazF antagonist)
MIVPLLDHQHKDACMGFEPIIKSFFAPEALAEHLEAEYGFQDVQCQLISATLRDVYLVESHAGRHILIIYRHDRRTWDEIAAEWRFVDYLAQHSIPVAAAIPMTTGEQILTLQAPEGLRYAVVTTYVAGQHLRRRPSVEATRRYGALIATIHVLADRAPTAFVRTTRDVVANLDQALAGIRAVLGDWLTERDYLERCVEELQTRLQTLPRETPAYGIIHGDTIRTNALVADDGRVTLIDFDWYGPGWRAYDIASYLLTIRGAPNEQLFAEAFLSGYTSVRTLAAREYGLLPLFEAARAILEIGTPAQHVNLWGSAYLESFVAQSLDRLKRSMQQLAET